MSNSVEINQVTDQMYADFFQADNGANVYSNSKALYGYLPVSKYLIITKRICELSHDIHRSERGPKIDLEILGKRNGVIHYVGTKDYANDHSYVFIKERIEIMKVFALNYIYLVTNNPAANKADLFFASGLRARWITIGCLMTDSTTDLTGGHRAFTEHIVVDGPDRIMSTMEQEIMESTTFGELLTAMDAFGEEFLAFYTSSEYGGPQIVKFAEAIWAMVEYTFRTRGHHYKPEYIPTYTKIINAAFEGNAEFPAFADLSALFHTAIHPFGVAALPILSGHFAGLGRLGNAFIIRFGASPNGTAVITTSAAALSAMTTEPWYNRFHAVYAPQIELCEKMAECINEKKFSYHNSATLYGLQKSDTLVIGTNTFTVEESKSQVAAIASTAQGFIDALTHQKNLGNISSFSFSNAKSLAKHQATNPLLSLKTKTLIELTVQLIADAKTTADATTLVYPSLE